MTYLYSSAEITHLKSDQPGGKAQNLLMLSLHQYPVPDWWLLPTAAVQDILDNDTILADLREEIAVPDAHNEVKIATLAEEIRQRIMALPLPPELEQALKTLDEQHPDRLWAVRSSCSDEDADNASFAGQMDSFLYQKGHTQLGDALRRVIASAYNERAVLYRLNKKLPLSGIRCAVIFQQMIDGDVSGVLFTAHPVTGDRQTMLISAGWGCGEGIVSGQCDTDEYTVALTSGEIAEQRTTKTTAIVFDRQKGSGTRELMLDDSKANAATLDHSTLLALRDMGASIARLYRTPQDIEWTLYQGKIYLLQSRPITHLPKDNHSTTESIICDNSNIQESYCGITTPLTFSFARAAYSLVYEQTLQLVGCPAKEINQRRAITDNMLSLVRGRVYYNIQNWYRALQLLPLFNVNKADMEAMMGLQDPVDIVQGQRQTLPEKLRAIPSLLRVLPRLHYALLTLKHRIPVFLQQFEQVAAHIDRENLHTLSPAQLITRLKYLDENLLARWTAPIVNDFYVANCSGKVQRMLASLDAPDLDRLKSDLLSNDDDLVSMEPTKALLAMSDELRAKPALAEHIHTGSGATLLASLQQIDPAFHQRCLDYIAAYGDRVIGELKLESITLRQNPDFLFTVLRNYLHASPQTSQASRMLRAGAEKQVFRLIEQQRGKRALRRFKKQLTCLRTAIRDRETMRFTRTKTFALYRDIYLQLGNQLMLEGILDNTRDIFWLTREEIYSGAEGTAVQTNLRTLTEQRRAEYQLYATQEEPAHHFYLQQTQFQQQSCHYPWAGREADSDTQRLQGTGCYPGIVEAPVSIVLSPENATSLAGKILCAMRTDPGWGPLFPGISGLLVERGSTLSHSAIVAREMNIPAIVGINSITRLLQQEEQVRMDGASGVIERLTMPDAVAPEETPHV